MSKPYTLSSVSFIVATEEISILSSKLIFTLELSASSDCDSLLWYIGLTCLDLFSFLTDIPTTYDSTENGVFAIKVRSGAIADEEL